MDVQNGWKYPLTVNHYLGSFERYKARDDPRRSAKVCTVWRDWLICRSFVLWFCFVVSVDLMGMDIEEWTDDSYMPDSFLQKKYDLV
jgi:hypothetical protein